MKKRILALMLVAALCVPNSLISLAAQQDDIAAVDLDEDAENTDEGNEEVVSCTECGEIEGHLETCSQYEKSEEEVTVCTECGAEDGHLEICSQYVSHASNGCSECGQAKSHTESCSQYASPAPDSSFEDGQTEERVEETYTGSEKNTKLAEDEVNEDDSTISEEEDEKLLENDVVEELEEDDASEEEFEAPADFTEVAEIPKLIKNWFQNTMFKLLSVSDDDENIEGDAEEEEKDDDGSQEDYEEDTDATRIDHPNIITEKTVIYDPEEGYKLRLESFLTGEPTITTDERVPSDIVIVLDQSGSMDDCFYCGDDKADSLVKTYTNLNLEKNYYVKGKSDATNGTKVYYCDNGDSCKYVDSDGGKKAHNKGWYTKSHTSKVTSAGTRYYPSQEDGPYFNMRIFYTDSQMTTKATNNIVKDGVYWISSDGEFKRVYYCTQCHAWFDTKPTECDGNSDKPSKHMASLARYPKASSSDKSYRSVTFYHRDYKHWVTDINNFPTETDVNFYVRTSGERLSGYSYKRVYHISGNTWNTQKNGQGTKYTYPDSRIYYTCPTNRRDALVDALNLFLEDIYKDSAGADGNLSTVEDNVDNRIAIVGFGSYDATTSSGVAPTNAVLSYSSDKSTAITIGYTDANKNIKEYYKHALWDVSTSNGQNIINDAVDSIQMVSNTETYKGIDMANKIFEQNVNSSDVQRNKIMVIFTDGYPYSPNKDSSGNTGNFAFANDAIENAKKTKNTYGATVYSIGIFSGANASGMTSTCSYTGTNNTKRANKFMHLISSNYLEPSTLKHAYDAKDVNPDLKTGSSYYLSASSTSALNDIFKSIAQSIVGGGAYITTLDETTQVTDTVSAKFIIPDGQDNIKAHTEKFTGESDGVMKWLDDYNSSIDDDLGITVNDNKVTVTGFNFAQYYVATDIDNEEKVPRGRKLVIEIPIEPSDSNNGGEFQNTNVSTSGIYLGNECYENFEMPHVDIPTDVTVTKTVIGKNVPKSKSFDFQIDYNKFNKSYEGNDESSGNYLKANYDDKKIEPKLAHEDVQELENILVGSILTIKELNTFDYLVEYKIDDGEWKILEADADGNSTLTKEVTPGMDIQIRNTIQLADLTIIKTGIQPADHHEENSTGEEEKQSSIFRVSGPDGFEMKVAIAGNDSVVMKDIPVGNYTVTELTDWTWRYTPDGKAKSVTVDPVEDNKVSFENSRTDIYWISGDCWCENWWGDKDSVVKRNEYNDVIPNKKGD